MVSGRKALLELTDVILSDEMLSRLIYFGENPLDDSKVLPDKSIIRNKSINYQPIDDSVNKENNVVLNLYKGFNKVEGRNIQPITKEVIGIMVLCPASVNNKDLRIYDIEERLVALLDGHKLKDAINTLNYVEGRFVALSSVNGYIQFNMIFEVADKRNKPYAKY